MAKLSIQDWDEVDQMLAKGVKHEEIAEIYGVHAVTIARHAASVDNRKNKMKQRLDPAVQAEIQKRLAAGEHKKAIATALGVHWSTIYREARKFAKAQ